MKKLISLILSIVLCSSMAATAAAATYEDDNSPPRIGTRNSSGEIE